MQGYGESSKSYHERLLCQEWKKQTGNVSVGKGCGVRFAQSKEIGLTFTAILYNFVAILI